MPRGGLQTSLVSMVNMRRRRFGVGPALARDVVRRPVAAPGSVVLQLALTYRGARLAHKTHARSTPPDRTSSSIRPHTAPGKLVDPTKYFIIIVNKVGN